MFLDRIGRDARITDEGPANLARQVRMAIGKAQDLLTVGLIEVLSSSGSKTKKDHQLIEEQQKDKISGSKTVKRTQEQMTREEVYEFL